MYQRSRRKNNSLSNQENYHYEPIPGTSQLDQSSSPLSSQSTLSSSSGTFVTARDHYSSLLTTLASDSDSPTDPLIPTISRSQSKMDKNFINILILGLSFLLLFTAFQTGGMIQVRIELNLLYQSNPHNPN